MRSCNHFSLHALCAQLIQVVLVVSFLLCSTSAGSSDSIVKSSSASNSRHKRAPGWGKRTSPGDEYLDEPDHSQEVFELSADMKRAPGWGKRSSTAVDGEASAEKRAPGWGKRGQEVDMDDDSMDQDKRAPGWGKRAPGWGKRAPGWGKRAPGWGKRAPGWGKRSSDSQTLERVLDEYLARELESSMSRRSSTAVDGEASAEKRAPGWGKRGQEVDVDDDSMDQDKRAPGWGKRAPGWGKRAPGWGKRAPGWGKRSSESQTLENALQDYLSRQLES
ncbi:cerebral peptide 1-like [Physella acuta]|uniref:cerebral peptide 1-like n=1 Tax=Physella acuta TaxID=109671 RepID=UPI0027DDC2DE|nr:cerebral peptide 1-like [Physella acuta]